MSKYLQKTTMITLMLMAIWLNASFAEARSSDLTSVPNAYILNDAYVIFNKGTVPFVSEQGDVYLPLKLIVTGLEYEILWEGITKQVSIIYAGKAKVFKYEKDSSVDFGYCLKGEDGRKFTAVIRNSSLYVQPVFFEEGLNNVVVLDQKMQLRIDAQKYTVSEASTIGEIISVSQGTDSIQVLVKGQAFGTFGIGDVSLVVKDTVPVKLTNGNALSLADLKMGTQIYIKYDQALTKSLPAQSLAKSVVVLKNEGFLEGKVYWKQASTESEVLKRQQIRIIGSADCLINVSEQTLIYDGSGAIRTYEDLKEGMVLRVVTAPYAAASTPAQTAAYRIEIIK